MNNIRHIVGLVLNTKDRRDSSSTASELDERFLTTLLEHQDSLKSRNGAALEILIEHSGVITSSGAARYCQAMFIMTWAEGNKFFDNLPFFTEDVLYKLIERRHAEWLIQGCIIGAMQGVVWLNKNQLWEPNHGIAFLGALYGAFLYSKSNRKSVV